MERKVMIAVGGTGGHLFPAQALVEQLDKAAPEVDVAFVGGDLDSNPYFDAKKYPYHTVSCGSVRGRNPFRLMSEGWKVLRGIVQSMKILKRYKPDAVVGFGSYHTYPVLFAARVLGIPYLLHEQNSVPGKVIRFFSKKAKVTGTCLPLPLGALKGRTIEVGMPLREGYTLALSSKRKARAYFNIDPECFTFLVFGGSQGALTVNTQFPYAAIELAERTKNFQVLHFTGSDLLVAECQQLYDDLGICATVKNFEQRMDFAWIACDLVISRAGAMTIAEMIELERPGLLIPYPYATDHHQEKNALYMQNVVGGAVTILDKDLDTQMLTETISTLVADKQKKLIEMQKAIQQYKKNKKHRDFCSVVCEVAGSKVR
ncbi:undecaprenyldiphospho-muramoylpentapeptide beta-N-acetylglucosaminyltransferase [Simkania negevensis]|uniref:UDP-N-acetylglucosamine--N-acetylmuramyl-(pentapeptide) pyrophosphoryl-undecaprenol N-acetylglucosamine transferase n=1 Tax=Simkania negevensis TaxID=83561 RepID=A0ABS3AQ73_9BACT|nr:undecaprenyldiphospho-muramoylpentapeptide beta-N-acetylglucosaminyltransferase [Simkania negevensis]